MRITRVDAIRTELAETGDIQQDGLLIAWYRTQQLGEEYRRRLLADVSLGVKLAANNLEAEATPQAEWAG